MAKDKIQLRDVCSKFITREDGEECVIDAYFAVFNSPYKMWEGAEEIILPGAFEESLKEIDVRALTNHDDTLVLGRMGSGTLTLKEDEKGLSGTIKINKNDTDAMNLYARVKRGDVNQCSIGFIIETEEFEDLGHKVRWSIKKVKLYEVSVVTFPAYEDTSASARKKDFEEIKKRETVAWKNKMLRKLKGE